MAGDLALDPVTFEVLKNSFITSVDQMGEQVLRTCYSFVIYNHDFSSALHDAMGECAAQGIRISPSMSARCTSPARRSCATSRATYMKATSLPSMILMPAARTSPTCA